MTLVTVLMPVYNVAHWLPETIQSVLGQTFSDFEFLIINDGSTDNSEEVIKSFDDPRITYVKNGQNLGYIQCLNFGLRRITSKYIVRMDADDICLPDRLALQVAYMEQHPEVAVCGGSRINIFENSNRKPQLVRAITDSKKLFIQSIFNTSIHHPCAIMRTSIVNENKLEYDERFYYAEDKDFWLRMSQFGVLANLPDPILYYRIHKKQVTFLFLNTQRDNSAAITLGFFKENGIEISEQKLKALRTICYEEACLKLSELFEVEQLIFYIVDKASEKKLFYAKDLEKEMQSRLSTIISRSSRLGMGVLKFGYKSELVGLKNISLSTYFKVISRYFYKGSNPFSKVY